MLYKKKKNRDTYTSVLIERDINISLKNDIAFQKSSIVMYALAYLLTVCPILCGMSYLNVDYSVGAIFLGTLLSFIIQTIGIKTKKASIFRYSLIISAAALCFVFFRKYLYNGCYIIANDYCFEMDINTQKFAKLCDYSTEYISVSLLLVIMCCLISIILINSICTKPSFLVVFICTAPWLESGLMFGVAPNYSFFFISLICLLAVLSIQFAHYSTNKYGKNNCFITNKKGTSFFFTSAKLKKSAFSAIAISTAMMLIVSFTAVFAVSNITSYKRSKNIDTMRIYLKKDFSINGFIEGLKHIEGGFNFSFLKNDKKNSNFVGGINFGNLADGKVSFSGEKQVNIELDKKMIANISSYALYLRAYVGTDYTGEGWEHHDSIPKSYGLSDFDEFRFLEAVTLQQLDLNDDTNSILTGNITLKMENEDLTCAFTPYYILPSNTNMTDDSGDQHVKLDSSNDEYKLKYVTNNSFIETLKSQPYSLVTLQVSSSDFRFYEWLYSACKSFKESNQETDNMLSSILTDSNYFNNCPVDYLTALNYLANYASSDLNSNFYQRLQEADYNETIDIEQNEPYSLILTNDEYGETSFLINNYSGKVLKSFGQHDFFEYFTKNHLYGLLVNFKVDNDDSITYNDAYEKYNKYVKDTYLDFNPDIIRSIPVINNFNPMNNSINDVINHLKNYFTQNFKYNLNAGKKPDNQDAIKYFLEVQKEGSCTHFSSASIMYFRSLGIPARFAEGYMVNSSTEIGDYQEDNNTVSFSISDKAAHAWVEVYLDNFGWIPIELTYDYNGENETILTSTSPTSTTTASTSTNVTTTTPKTTSSQPTTTTPPAVTTVAPQMSTTITTEKPVSSSKNSFDITTAIIILIIIAVPSLIVAAVRTSRTYGLKRMNNAISMGNQNEKAINIYNYILKYLKLINISTHQNITDIQRAEIFSQKLAQESYADFSNEIINCAKIAVKAKNTDYELSDDELTYLNEQLDSIKNAIYLKLSGFEKFYSKYFRHMY